MSAGDLFLYGAIRRSQWLYTPLTNLLYLPVPKDPLVSEVHQLLEHMEAIPLLRHEMMACYQCFLLKNRDLVESSLKPAPSPPSET